MGQPGSLMRGSMTGSKARIRSSIPLLWERKDETRAMARIQPAWGRVS